MPCQTLQLLDVDTLLCHHGDKRGSEAVEGGYVPSLGFSKT